MPVQEYDALIIGTGQGGTPLSKKLAKAGWKTAIVERAAIGGTCINTGCTPTKTLIASARAAYVVAHARQWGVEVDGYHIHLPEMLKRKQEVVDMFRTGTEKGFGKTDGLTVIKGTASFTGPKEVTVTTAEGEKMVCTAKKIFINAGCTAAVPEVEGISGVTYYTAASMMEVQVVPEHLIIIGSGYIGLEFGQLYRRLGSKVTILEKSKRILAKEDEDTAEEMENILTGEGVVFSKSTTVLKATEVDGKVTLTVKEGENEKVLEGTHLLIAAGRKPAVEQLNLAAAGVSTDEKGFIKVDELLQTSAPDIYALGDVKGGPQFTHIAYNDYIILYNNLVKDKHYSTRERIVPYCVFTDPQLGRAGITEKEAREKGLPYKVVKFPGKNIARAIESGDTRGWMKAVINTSDDTLLGVAIIGEQGGEVMSVMQMAMLGNIKWPQLRETIFAHPLYAESINNLFMQLDA